MKPIVDTDKSKLDVDFIHNFLKDIYWAKGRTREEIITTIENSRCYGLYLDGKQIGFTRVVTDYAVFAYLMDVFVVEEHRGKSYASVLMDAVIHDPGLANVKIWRLATIDAGFLYAKYGFTPLAHPERLMEKIAR